jgi:hypothetical protein
MSQISPNTKINVPNCSSLKCMKTRLYISQTQPSLSHELTWKTFIIWNATEFHLLPQYRKSQTVPQ